MGGEKRTYLKLSPNVAPVKVAVFSLLKNKPAVVGKNVILVDDGLATGVSMRVAVEAVLKQRPKRLVVAVPVGSGDAVSSLRERLRPADEVVCLDTPENFSAVGMWYRHFPQVTDEEVVRVLEEARARFRAGKV